MSLDFGGFSGSGVNAEQFVDVPDVPARATTVDSVQVPDAVDVMSQPWSWSTEKILYVVAGVVAVSIAVFFIADFVKARNEASHTHESGETGS